MMRNRCSAEVRSAHERSEYPVPHRRVATRFARRGTDFRATVVFALFTPLILVLVSHFSPLHAQSAPWTPVRTIALPEPGAASLDRRGNLYVTDAQNNLHQYAPDGQPLNTYSPPLPGHTAQVEAWNTAKILVFYDDRQQVVVLDRFLAPITEVALIDYLDGVARTVTLAPDDRYWLLNESDLTLRQFDAAQKRFTLTTPLDLLVGRTRPDFRFLREYQNNLYLLDRTTGVYVFDNLGNYRKKLPLTGLSYIGFRGDELYYLAGGQVHFFHLYQLTERTSPVPAPEARQVLVGERYAYCLTPQGVQVYKMSE